MRYCTKCSSNIPEDADFCPKCGTKQRKPMPETPDRVIRLKSVNTVILSLMLADVNIEPADVVDVEVTVVGDAEMKEKVLFECLDEMVKISCEIPTLPTSSAFSGSNVFSSFDGNSMIVSSGSYSSSINFSSNDGINHINGMPYYKGQRVDTERKLQLLIKVPQGTNVRIGKLEGNTLIGNTEGDVEASISGETKISTGRIANLNIKISGSGHFVAEEAKGAVDAKVSGVGNITIKGGTSESFTAKVSGVGGIRHNGTSKTKTDLSVSGVGNIYLFASLVPVYKHRSGVGSISVINEPKGTASAFNDCQVPVLVDS